MSESTVVNKEINLRFFNKDKLDEIDFGDYKFLVAECITGRHRKFWRNYAEKRGWNHQSIRTGLFDRVMTLKCGNCSYVSYVSEMPLACCEMDPENRYCDNCSDIDYRNVIDLTSTHDSEFKSSERGLNAVVCSAGELPNLPKGMYRKRRKSIHKSDDNVSAPDYQTIILTNTLS